MRFAKIAIRRDFSDQVANGITDQMNFLYRKVVLNAERSSIIKKCNQKCIDSGNKEIVVVNKENWKSKTYMQCFQ